MTARELFRDGAVTVAEAVKFSGIGRTSLYALMKEGLVPFSVVRGRRLIPRRNLVALLAENVEKPK